MNTPTTTTTVVPTIVAAHRILQTLQTAATPTYSQLRGAMQKGTALYAIGFGDITSVSFVRLKDGQVEITYTHKPIATDTQTPPSIPQPIEHPQQTLEQEVCDKVIELNDEHYQSVHFVRQSVNNPREAHEIIVSMLEEAETFITHVPPLPEFTAHLKQRKLPPFYYSSFGEKYEAITVTPKSLIGMPDAVEIAYAYPVVAQRQYQREHRSREGNDPA